MPNTTELNLLSMSGQGAVQAGEALAKLFANQGWFVSVNIYPGTRARSAPVLNYVKISDAPGLASCANYHPSEVIVFQEELLLTAKENTHELIADAIGRMKKGTLLVNSPKSPQELDLPFDLEGTVATVDATEIAGRLLRRNPPPLMDLADAPFPDACRNPELAARLAATGHTQLGFDSVMPYFTIIQESSALGCDMQWEEKDNWPTVRMANPIWKGLEDIKIPSGFLEHPDNQTIIRSIRLLKEEFGDEVAVIGKTMGPWTLAYHVFGVENFLLMTVDDPDLVMRCLDRLKEISVLFGQAQIDAGADVLTFPDHATGDLVSGEYYKRFLLDIHQEMSQRLDVPLILHICGNTLDRMDYIAQSGMACFHFDSKNDPQQAMDIMDGRIRMVGNINNPETLYARGPEEVRREVYRCLDAGVDLIAPECAVPLATKLESLIEIPKAVKDWCEEHTPNDINAVN
jgi:MtaA/CmuA family methyltransferase